MVKRFKKLRRSKKIKKVKDLVPTQAVEKVQSLNPVAPLPPEQAMSLENVPQITNETITEHREEVLSGARKFIYPLAHSKRAIVFITGGLVTLAVIAFLVYSAAGLYRLYQHNTFLYRVTQVVPFPVAKVGGDYVAYENYLFELRRQIHYYEEQQGEEANDFSTTEDKEQLAEFRKQSLTSVIDFAYVKKLAARHGVKVSGKELDARLAQMREQNRLGSSDKVFADVLRDFWGWSVADFRRSLNDQILTEKVTAKLDTEATAKANNALTQVKSGADFATVATQTTEDLASKASGGDYGFPITKSNPNVPPQVVDVLFRLKPGQTSGVINTGKALEIIKLEKIEGDVATARHIVFYLKDISAFLADIKKEQPTKTYVKF